LAGPVLDLILASRSPRRASLLAGLGLPVRVEPSGIDEAVLPGESPEEHVLRLAAGKAAAVRDRVEPARDGTVVLAADTVVVLGDRILGKPGSSREAVEMLLMLAGREHRVVSGVRLLRPATRGVAEAASTTRVRFVPMDERMARRYVATGEAADKAGAYGIQGVGALLVASIEGSWSNVVGLPLERLPGLFRRVGLDLWDGVSPVAEG
jgi:septum formation protein